MITEVAELKDFIVKVLEDKKAENINIINLGKENTIADYMIFANGRSTRNVSAIAESLAQELKDKTNITKINIEGLRQAEWVLIDVGDIIVHIFHPETREHYRLEEKWSN